MPILSLFYGIIVRIFHNDHPPPHLHVQYGEYNAIVEIKSGKIIHGKLPKTTQKLFEKWRKMHIHELNIAWKNAQHLIAPKRIKPLE